VSKTIIQKEEESPFAGGPPRIDALYLSPALSPLQESKGNQHLLVSVCKH
jgi:hypothetical protein